MITATAIGAILKEHWPKILAAILVPVILGSVALWFQKQERDQTRAERALVEQGEQKVIIRAQERTINDVQKANDAVERPTPASERRVHVEGDRCANNPACL